jgi:endo-1,4-beta-xylanase
MSTPISSPVLRGCRFLAMPLVLLAVLAARPAVAQTLILQNDFEDGTVQGWIPRGPVTLTNSGDVGSRTGGGGARSLKTTGRTAGFNGPSLNTLPFLAKGATYQVSVWVRLVSGQTANQLKITMQRTVSGANSFDTVAQSATGAVTDAGWTQITGLYAYAGGDPTGLLLYVEADSATASYYIDDFRIDKISDAPGLPPNTTGLTSTFESGTAEGWTSRTGTEVVSPSSADAHTGAFSLLTTNRTATFRGPNFNVTNVMFNGSRYKVSVWARLAPGESPAQLRVSLQRNAGTVTTFHTVIGNTNVTADAWVRLTTTYDVALANSSLFLYVESASSLASFSIDDVQITYVPPPTIEADLPSVYQSLAGLFPVGAAVRNTTIAGVHGDLLKKHFNSMTSENDMKWDATEASASTFTFTNADQQVSFAQANGMRVRGHTLVWHSQIPAWVFTDPLTGTTMLPTPANHDLLLQRLTNHIQGVVSHFGDKVYAWDVANEVIDESQPDCMRRSTWFNVTGKDFIDTAFRTARTVAPPGTVLLINDYNTTIPAKRTCLYNLVSDLQSRGVPVDGVGHQMHSNLEFPSVADLATTLDLFAGLGVTQQVTEMDISVYTGSNNTPIANYDEIPADRFLKQGRDYRDYFQLFRQHAGQLSSVTLWGLADDSTWLTSSGKVDGPLLFDDQLHHKLAYTGVVDPQDLPKTAATVVLSGLAQTYEGGPHAVSVVTTPPGLAVEVRYDGSLTPPVNAGTYAVEATIDSPDYAGSATGTLVVGQAPATVLLGGLSATYDGSPHAASATTAPPGLAVAFTYDGALTPPTDAGRYAVVATVVDVNYFGSAVGTLTIGQSTAAVSFASLTLAYDGTPRAVTVVTVPAGLAVVVTYDGAATPPTAPGSYAVVATVQDANYVGSATGTLSVTTTVRVRHAPSINGRVDGSVEVLLPESATLNGGAILTGDLLVPGTPAVRLNGSPAYGGTIDGAGAASPSSHMITLNGGASLRHVVRRTDAVALPAVQAPPPPTGTRDAVINSAGQGPGSFATLRNLTLNGSVGAVAVPAGTYGTFIVNGSSSLVLGAAGATTPAVYNLQGLVLNGGSKLTIVGPVVINLAGGATFNGPAGTTAHPEWLALNIASGGLTVNGGAAVYGAVAAPAGAVMINGTVVGGVAADRLTINGGGRLTAAP